jgi:transposase
MDEERIPLTIPADPRAQMTPAVVAFVESLARIAALRQTVAEQQRLLDELRSQGPRTPQNSSQPPSTQHPQAKPATPQPPSPRRRGGQLGHAKTQPLARSA